MQHLLRAILTRGSFISCLNLWYVIKSNICIVPHLLTIHRKMHCVCVSSYFTRVLINQSFNQCFVFGRQIVYLSTFHYSLLQMHPVLSVLLLLCFLHSFLVLSSDNNKRNRNLVSGMRLDVIQLHKNAHICL